MTQPAITAQAHLLHNKYYRDIKQPSTYVHYAVELRAVMRESAAVIKRYVDLVTDDEEQVATRAVSNIEMHTRIIREAQALIEGYKLLYGAGL